MQHQSQKVLTFFVLISLLSANCLGQVINKARFDSPEWACVAYQLNAFADVPEKMPRIYSDLHANIQDVFNRASIEIMSPHYRAVRDGNPTTIPRDANNENE